LARTHAKAIATRLENELANLLWEMGYAVVRGPSSGSGAKKRYQPDLVAIKNGVVIVIEVKKGRRGKPLYIPARQLKGLREFAKRARALVVIAVRLPGAEWRIHKLDDLSLTPRGNAKIEAPETGIRLEIFDELLFPKHRKLVEFVRDD